ncbi:hypothetical protein THO17_28000 [Marinomonas sp. THO17]
MKNDYRYDHFGNLDTDFYVEKAYELRRAYYAQAINSAKTRIKAFFTNLMHNHSMKSASQH